MMKIAYFLFVGLMLAGNCFAFYQLLTGKASFIQKFPEVTEKNFFVFQVLPLINLIGLAGMLFFKSWSPYLVIAGAMLVIAADIYFGIRYHLYVAIPSALLLFFFIYHFNKYFQ